MTGAGENYRQQPSLIYFLAEYLSILWKDWPAKMDVTTLGSNGDVANFTLVGICPHCDRDVGMGLGLPRHEEDVLDAGNKNKISGRRYVTINQCPSCKKFVLRIVFRPVNQSEPGQPSREDFIYEEHYPLGTPNDSVEDGIPKDIGDEFVEAIRCQWVKAYNASASMCRRAIESSCLEKGAKGYNLEEKIKDLAEKGLITKTLQEMAQRIRLTGNLGAHPPANEKQKLNTPTPEQVDALIAFTREYLRHVYATPLRMETFMDRLPKPEAVSENKN